ncbi:MAG TPA: hypothetical protein VNO86_03810 [Candidatus Binatia bacterium]|nr:hypothetical protein [Candidatus Binatia bacterium]
MPITDAGARRSGSATGRAAVGALRATVGALRATVLVRLVALVGLVGLVGLVVGGCAGPAGPPASVTGSGAVAPPATGTPAPSAPGASPASPSPSAVPSERPVASPPDGAATLPPSGAPVSGEVPEAILASIIEDAAERTGADPATARVLRAEAVTWSDGSLGCPEPGMFYIQVLIDGYWVVVEIGGQTLDYRVGSHGAFRLCEEPTSGAP